MRLTQKQLGDRIGVTQVYISKIEKGDIEGLTIGKLTKLANVLQITPSELLDKLLNNEKGWAWTIYSLKFILSSK